MNIKARTLNTPKLPKFARDKDCTMIQNRGNELNGYEVLLSFEGIKKQIWTAIENVKFNVLDGGTEK